MRQIRAILPAGAWGTLRWIWNHPLAARNRPGALARWVRWQVGSRVTLGPVVVPFVGETVLLVNPGMTGATGNIYVGLHEFSGMAFLLHYLRATDRFIDVGANIGSYTILAAGVRHAEAIAVEPLPATFHRLRANVRLNDLDNRVRAMNVGLASTPGILRFTRSLDTINHVLSRDDVADVDTVEVPVTTLDQLAEERPPALIKVDVEGFETEVFAGAEHVLAQPVLRAVLVELNGSGVRYGFDEAALQRRIESFGFRLHTYDPLERILRPSGRKDSDGNALYVRDFAEVQNRIRQSPPVRVLGVDL